MRGPADDEFDDFPLDPESSSICESNAVAQVRNAFANMKRVLEAADMALTDVVKVTVFLADEGDRNAVNGPWTEVYPDPAHRPARHALVMPLRGGARIQLEVTAYATEA